MKSGIKFEELRDELIKDGENKEYYDRQRGLIRLGRLFKRSRTHQKLPQQTIAKTAGIAQADISRIESGVAELGPSFDTLVKLAHAQKMRLVVELVPEEKEEEDPDDPSRQFREAF